MEKEQLGKEISHYIHNIITNAEEVERLCQDNESLDKYEFNYIKEMLHEMSENLEDLCIEIREDIHWGK